MSKRLLLITVFCPLWIFSYGQNLDEIHFKGEVITITGERLKKVDRENSVWEIDLKNDEAFKLVSDHKEVVSYKFSKMCVQGHTGKVWKSFYEIPHRKDTLGRKLAPFWKTTVLRLSKDSLPLDLHANGKKIATFRLKMQAQYQIIEKLDKKEYSEGDPIGLLKSEESANTIKIVDETIKLVSDNKHSYELKENVIIEGLIKEGESTIYNIIVSVSYSDKTKKEFNLGSIVIHKKKGAISNGLDIGHYWDQITPWVYYFIIGIFLVVLVLCRKQIHKYWEKNCLRVRSYFEKTDDTEEHSNNDQETTIDKFQIGHDDTISEDKPNQQDVGYQECIQTLNRRIRDLENQLENLSGDALDIKSLKERIEELEKSENAKLDEIDELSNENATLKQEKKCLQDRLDNISIDSTSKKDLRNKIEELKDDKNKLIREKQSKERDLADARKNITNLEGKVKEKEDKIAEINKQKDEAESNLRIEKNSIIVLQKKINSFSKQTYYVYAIDDAMHAVDSSLKYLFADVRDENLMKRLAQPVLSGTAGLDTGLESYLNEWKNSVYDNQKQFFGDDVLNMSDNSVKEKLAEFLEQLALRDSFGKLVRLYLMSNVGWINDKMVAAGFDVDAIQTLFARFKNLFTLFNIEISYPRLFVDKFDSNRHKDNMRCEIFNYFEPSVELLTQLKNRENENLIVDVTRIGIPNSKIPTRRNAMVSLPNF